MIYGIQLIEATTGKRTKPVFIKSEDMVKTLSKYTKPELESEDYVIVLYMGQVNEDNLEQTSEFAHMIPLMRVTTFINTFLVEENQNG